MLAALLLALLAPLAAPSDRERDAAVAAALQRCFPGELDLEHDAPPPGDRLLLEDALAGPAFVRAEAGPLDVYVYVAGGFAKARDASAGLEALAAGLAPVGQLLARRFPRPAGLLSGRRFPVVCASSAPGDGAWDELLALLEWCERDGSGWVRDNGPLWTKALRGAPRARTWEVLLLNLAHDDFARQGPDFAAHGAGYEVLAHLAHRLLRLGSWGSLPPWLDQGLIDELDIEAYGESWVGGNWYVSETEGWYRPGWEGFVPQGQSPPPPVTGPPADLATRVRQTGDPWAHRAGSGERHWEQLRADVARDYPPSLAFMAEHQSFLPRDRAYARCAWHLLLELAPGPRDVLELLDHEPQVLPGGMFTAPDITAVLSAALGGVPGVDELARRPLRQKLAVTGQAALAARIEQLGAAGVLDVADHRDAGEWLYSQPQFEAAARAELFRLILTAEYHEQELAMRVLAEALDRAVAAALLASEHYPRSPRDREAVARAFRAALAP